MANITIYTTPTCPYCSRAKTLLTRKGASFEEINVSDRSVRAKMTERAGGRTSVPQIFINNQHIGGCDDLYALDLDDALDALLNAV
jgi:glutaredoxin 3